MWKTAERMGLTQNEINNIAEELWFEACEDSNQTCPDCRVGTGENHRHNCEISICPECGIQAIQCDEHTNDIIWDGLYPNTKECYENKWIICWQGDKSCYSEVMRMDYWIFDYTKATSELQLKLQKK